MYNINRLKKIIMLRLSILVVVFCFPSVLIGKNAFESPKLSNPDSWTMIMLPDPQAYITFDRNQPLFDLMITWIASHVDSLNINMVVCTGDLVNHNYYLNPDGINANQTSVQQWEAVSKSFERLDGIVPYALATGNHDYTSLPNRNRQTFFDDYFPSHRNRLNLRVLRDVGTDAEGYPTLANASYEIITPQKNKYLILVLEYAPCDITLAWAEKIIKQQKYIDHKVILLTHSYMYDINRKNERIVSESSKLETPNWGADIWQKLVKPSKNISLVLCGHTAAPDDWNGAVGFRKDRNSLGKIVPQMMFNTQALGGGWRGNGGDGWLRILEFLPDGKTVKVKTFSPLFAISPSTRHLAWNRESYNEFIFELE